MRGGARGANRGASQSRSPSRRSFSGSPRPQDDSRARPSERPASLRPARVGGKRRRRKQPAACSMSRSPPPMRKDAFGRNVARRGSRSPSIKSDDSRGRSSSRGSRGKMPAMAMPGMFPGMFPGMPGMGMPGMPGMPSMGGKGFPFPGMMNGDMQFPANMWEAHKQWFAQMQSGAGKGSRGNRDSRRSRSRSKGHSKGRRRSPSDEKNQEGKVSATIPVPRSIMGRVIGKQGATINDIREQSACRIDAEDIDKDSCEFKLSGLPENVEKAKKMIRDIMDKTATGPILDNRDDDKNSPIEIFEFPASVTGRIIGAKGAKIAEVRHTSGAKVQVEKGDDKCKVHITGTPDQIERARAMVTKIAEEADDSLQKPSEDDPVNDFLEFPVSATGGIIGSRGAKIAEVRQESGAKVQVEKLETCCKVLIAGTQEQVDAAKVLLRRLVEETQERAAAGGGSTQGGRRGGAEEHMEVPQSLVGRVIGKGGETIQRIQKESGAHVDVNTQSGDPCAVKITGNSEAVCHARFLISEIIDKGGLRSDGGSGMPPPPPQSGYWPESGFAFGGPPPGAAWMGGGSAWDPYGDTERAQLLDQEMSSRNEIDMDEL